MLAGVDFAVSSKAIFSALVRLASKMLNRLKIQNGGTEREGTELSQLVRFWPHNLVPRLFRLCDPNNCLRSLAIQETWIW
jgi:hypothetical protein